MDIVSLDAKLRKIVGKGDSKKIRATGLVPAVVYGLEGPAVNISLPIKSLLTAFKGPFGKNTLLELKIADDEKTISEKVVTYKIAKDALTQEVLQVDFMRIDLQKPLTLNVKIKFVGVSPGVKLGGIFNSLLTTIKVKCLAKDILSVLELDISVLGLSDSLHVRDLPKNDKYTYLKADDCVIACVEAPRSAATEETTAAAPAAAPAAGAKAAAKPADKK